MYTVSCKLLENFAHNAVQIQIDRQKNATNYINFTFGRVNDTINNY